MRYTHENTAAVGSPKRVFVNGSEVAMATVADTVKGEVICYSRPLRLDENKKDQLCTQTLHGRVTIKDVKKWRPI